MSLSSDSSFINIGTTLQHSGKPIGKFAGLSVSKRAIEFQLCTFSAAAGRYSDKYSDVGGGSLIQLLG